MSTSSGAVIQNPYAKKRNRTHIDPPKQELQIKEINTLHPVAPVSTPKTTHYSSHNISGSVQCLKLLEPASASRKYETTKLNDAACSSAVLAVPASPAIVVPSAAPATAPNPYVFAASSESSRVQEESASALVIAACDKAGMQGIDRARIDAIILRESGNSLYMQQQRRRDENVNKRIAQLKEKLKEKEKCSAGLDQSWKVKLQDRIDRTMVPEILRKRPCRSTCVVVDMDMFYMACELLTRPDLKKVPACVGHGMITTSNYIARQYGVRSAMAGWIGDKLVEELSEGKEKLVHVSHNFDLYKEKSHVVRNVLADYDPHLRAYSLDEVYMNLAPYIACKLMHPEWPHEVIRDHLILSVEETKQSSTNNKKERSDEYVLISEVEPGEDGNGDDPPFENMKSLDILSTSFSFDECNETLEYVVKQMRHRVEEATGGLTCSAGIAPNFMLAKIASDYNKPNGQKLVDASSHERICGDFLYSLPCRKVPGIGRVTDKILSAFGIHTVRELYEQRALVNFLFQTVSARNLLHASLGCSLSDDHQLAFDTDASDDDSRKGISRERTFSPQNMSWSDLVSRLEGIGQLLASDMAEKQIWARTITVKVKLHTFDVISKCLSLPKGVYIQAAEDLSKNAIELFREIRNNCKETYKNQSFAVRLLGIRCSNFRDDHESCGQKSIAEYLQQEQPNKEEAKGCGNENGAKLNVRTYHSIATTTTPPPRVGPRETFASATSTLSLPSQQMTLERFLETNNRTSRTTENHDTPAIKEKTFLSSQQQRRKQRLLAEPSPFAAFLKKNAKETAPAATNSNEVIDIIDIDDEQDGFVARAGDVGCMVQCPVCGTSFAEHANDALNRHVDACLSGGVVRQVLRQQRQQQQQLIDGSNKKRRLLDFFYEK